MSAKRLSQGGRIDRSQSVSFKWDGNLYNGFAGDSLASALMANGERVLGRSFKYHRPRGIMSAGVEESGAIVTIGEGAKTDANVKATTQELYDGLVARGQNAFPSVRFDLGGVNNLFNKFFAAGFYYKTFMGLPPFEWGSKGTWLWMQYEKVIRRAAGMGRASREFDPDHYEHGHDFCDVLVVGSGPAGISAALEASEAGLDVLLVEQDWALGGNDLSQVGDLDLVAALEASNVRVMTRTTAFGLYDYGVAGLLERVTDHMADAPDYMPRQRFWTVRAKYTVVASGALERLVAFGDNDRPGIMSAASASTYLHRYGVLAGQEIALSTNNDSAYAVAADLANAGASVSMLDARASVGGAAAELASSSGIDVTFNAAPMRAIGSKGVKKLEYASSSEHGWHHAGTISCDLALVSGGWSPIVNLLSHRGVKPVWNADNCCFMPSESNEPLTLAGSAAGHWNRQDCLASGQAAGQMAANAIAGSKKQVSVPANAGWENPIEPLYEVQVDSHKLKSFIDPQHDVTAEDVRLAHREGYVSVEHLKRYTTLGMATDQGKMGNIIGIALMAEALGKDIPEVGTTTFRPPYTPISLGALTGRGVFSHFKPLRRTPMNAWNLEKGAVMTEAGLWHRPWYFPEEGEGMSEAYIREATITRNSLGLCDVTSLGKIAIQGPDATTFLNRVYTNAFAKLAIGKARYGIMLRDDGTVMDDGNDLASWRD